jgi:monomeric phenylalanine-4-hydroxylase
MQSATLLQDYEIYSEEDHQTWQTLIKRHKLKVNKISSEYLDGFSHLKLSETRIIRIDEISERLEGITGWTLVPVTGLIPTKDFFYMLLNRKYPVTVSIRKSHEIEFSEQPDIFHDVCGHLPLLTNEKFLKFLTAYSLIALKYVNNDRAIEFLGRLYWYTYEMGIIRENGEFKAYGGAVITSADEITNLANAKIQKYNFDVDQIFRTVYNPFKLQNEYFVIDSFDDLFNCLEVLETKIIEHLLMPEQDCTIRNYSLNPKIGKGFNNVIGFLNDTQYKFPNAISFVAGQPDENFFDIENQLDKFDVYVNYLCKKTGQGRKTVINKIGQYSKTKGIINEIISEYLRNDENISIAPEHILITVGAQEAFSIIVGAICDRDNDVIVVEDPSYIGLSSFAKVFDYNICGVPIDEEGIMIKRLKSKIIEINGCGKRVKLVYVIPDYQNPSGACMSIGNRLKLLELARQYNFLIIEDSVYNSFTYAQKKHPTLKSLDTSNRVIYVGSFSKSLFPGLRVGVIAADQVMENEFGENVLLIDEMVKVKAQLTNNTSTISQAILGGVLVELNFSLSDWSKPKFESYKKKRNAIVEALNKNIKIFADSWAREITWNEPDGGFFIKMALPFAIDIAEVLQCAEKFNVIFCPMRNFYLETGGENEIRLTFSNLSLDQIEKGIAQLAAFLKFKTLESVNETFKFESNYA